MFSEYLRKRTVKCYSNVDPHKMKSGTRHELLVMLQAELDVFKKNNRQIEQDHYGIALNFLKNGDLIGCCDYLEPISGTNEVSGLFQNLRKRVKEYQDA